MMPYVLMCLAFVRLRRADPRPRPYRMPLGDRLASLWALFVALHVLAGICLFVVTPARRWTGPTPARSSAAWRWPWPWANC